MNTWNDLPFQYWKKVYDSIRAALNKLILQEKGVNNTQEEAIDTRGMAYNKNAMAAQLGEPTIEQPVIAAVEIPRANDIYFDAEDGVSYEVGGEGEDGDEDGDENRDEFEDGDTDGDADGDGDGEDGVREDDDDDDDEQDDEGEDEEDEDEDEEG